MANPRETSFEKQTETSNVSGVLSASSYSLRDISGDWLESDNDGDLLDESVLAQLDKPYSQLDDRLRLRKQDKYDGFDNSTGNSWIYPTNYPVRQYQFSITKAALFKNTLVVLPTGLGKTFIAAVVMYNIYRWYPTGKVIFMAPTRPLVNQQVEACYRIMGIPREDTAEITGRQQRKNRAMLWQNKRVFYVTPQVVQADICAPEQAFPVEQVRLVVIDEAHKAKGRYAYTEVIKLIVARNKQFRVLALSATPGRTLENVAEVIQNLLISHIEVRWENSIDVAPYTFRKSIRTIVIPLGQTISTVRDQLLQLIGPYVRRLLDANVLCCGNPATMTRGMMIMEQTRFRENSVHRKHPNHSSVSADFSVCVSMYHALDLLLRHGIRALLNFFADGSEGNSSEKYFVAKDRHIKEFVEQLRERYGNRAGDGEILTDDDDINFGHPKFRILEKHLVQHFAEEPDSKAMVFCEFRDSVAMIHRLLSKRAPLIRPKCIVGQGGTSGIRAVTQKEQLSAMQKFRAGVCNTLIATCVAEEGIDVGEVDLIVCFDITKNPTRFVQRIGRTGRQRVGRVLMLVTEGEEHQTLKRVLASKDRTNQQLAKSENIMRVLYRHSPRLVPDEFEPQCVEMFINKPAERTDEAIAGATATPGVHRPRMRGSDADLEPHSKRRRMAQAVTSPAATPPKSTLDIRKFLQRAHQPTEDELDAGERDVFCLPGAPPKRSPEQSGSKLHNRSCEAKVDQCLRTGRSDQELAIERCLQPLIRHYEQLKRQKFIHRQQLLNVPTIEQILKKRSLAIVRSEVVRHVLLATSSTKPTRPKMDDPYDLLPLRGSPILLGPPPPPPPTDRLVPELAQSQEQNASISDLFDTQFNLSDIGQCFDTPRRAAGSRKLLTTHGPSPAPSGEKLTKSSAVPCTATIRKQAATSPVDLLHCPLMRAFNRSVQKCNKSEGNIVSAGVPEENANAATKTPVRGQAAMGRKTPRTVCKEPPLAESPLLRAFNRSVQKRSNSNGDRDGAANLLQQKMVLEYFKLPSIEFIFSNHDEEEAVARKARMAATIGERSNVYNAAVGESDVAIPTPSGRKLRQDRPVQETEADECELLELLTATGGKDAESLAFVKQPFRADTGAREHNQITPEKLPWSDGSSPLHRSFGDATTDKQLLVGVTSQKSSIEKKGRNKDFNLGSAALVFEDSDEDPFGFSDQIEVEGNNSLNQQATPRRQPAIKPTKKSNDGVRSNVSETSEFNPTLQKPWCQIGSQETSPSVLGSCTVTRSNRSTHLAPTKLNFSRLQLPPSKVPTDQRKEPSVEQTSSPYFGSKIYQNAFESQPFAPLVEEEKEVDEDCVMPLKCQDESTIIMQRRERGRRPLRVVSDSESESETDRGKSVRECQVIATNRLLTTFVKEDFFTANDGETVEDDISGARKSGVSSTRVPVPPNKRRKVVRRQAAHSFFQSQAAVSGSDDEYDDEHELADCDEMKSFLDLDGSQSSEADATCVDMRAIYLQSVRSPMVARGRFKIPAARLKVSPRAQPVPLKHSSPCTAAQEADDSLEPICGHREEGSQNSQELLDSSFINNVIEVDSELSELEQLELILRERRRASKRKRKKGGLSDAASMKRQRTLFILSDSE